MAVKIRRRYVEAGRGQVHLTETTSGGGAPPLWCFHATAYSGNTFLPLMQAISPRRRVVAADTPGYGGSDRPEAPMDMAGYAAVLGEAIEAAGDGPVDLFGYHTGAFAATELAAQRPDLVRRLVLVGVPYFPAALRETWRQKLAPRHTLTEALAQFDHRWDYLVANRPHGMSLERGFTNFVDELRSYPEEWWAHDAAFTYDAEPRLRAMAQNTLVLNPDNHLSEPSRQAAAMMPNGSVTELPDLDHAIFDRASPRLAALIEAFLDS